MIFPHRPTLVAVVAAATLAILPAMVAQTDTAAKQPKPKIGSRVFKWEDLTVRTTPNGERRDVADNPTANLSVFECHITTLNPGKESHAPHRHPQEELIVRPKKEIFIEPRKLIRPEMVQFTTVVYC